MPQTLPFLFNADVFPATTCAQLRYVKLRETQSSTLLEILRNEGAMEVLKMVKISQQNHLNNFNKDLHTNIQQKQYKYCLISSNKENDNLLLEIALKLKPAQIKLIRIINKGIRLRTGPIIRITFWTVMVTGLNI